MLKNFYLKFEIQLFLVSSLLSRIILLLYSAYYLEVKLDYSFLFFKGMINDIVTLIYVIPVFYILKSIFSLLGRRGVYFYYFIIIYMLLFNISGEIIFYEEFNTRYNFIAVDYLVYTNEIIGTLKESIYFEEALIILFFLSSFILYLCRKNICLPDYKSKIFPLFILMTLWCYITDKYYDPERFLISENKYDQELSKNGLYSLFSAFRNNTLDFDEFYLNLPPKESAEIIKQETGEKFLEEKNPLTRLIKSYKKPNKYNVVFILVESLSAEFLAEFGNKDNITPFLNEISNQSIFFTNLYASGTRTVRGIEAILLSIPPTPGSSIVRRPENEKLFNMGSVFNEYGYESKFIYGGYSYFDNMKYFFENNGFKIVDRGNLSSKEISFSNIWGVADGDIYKRTLKECDESFAHGKRFFNFILTTSNHRPYTFPQDKIDLAQGSRKAGVKYTDYAIREFIKEAKTKKWFKDTIFVITADHCASSAGKVNLPIKKYHIPLLIYAPSLIKPQRIEKLVSQIDIAPTLLNLLNFSYKSKFFGVNALSDKHPNRAFISTYQLLGYLKNSELVILSPSYPESVIYNVSNSEAYEMKEEDNILLKEATAYYSLAYYLYKNKLLGEE